MAATTIISDPDTDDEAVPEDERFYFFCIASHQVMSKVSRRVKRKEVTFGHSRRGLEGTIDAEFKFALSAKCNLMMRTGPSLTCFRGGGAAHCISQQFSIMPQMQHTSLPGNSTKTISVMASWKQLSNMSSSLPGWGVANPGSLSLVPSGEWAY